MIDPKTLKVGDKIKFAGVSGDLTVNFVDSYSWGGPGSGLGVDKSPRFIEYDSPFWQIAELKKPELPFVVGGGWECWLLQMDKRCYALSEWQKGHKLTASSLLAMSREIVKELEAAGVK